MHRYVLVAGVLSVVLLGIAASVAAFAATPKQKNTTCKLYADSQKYVGTQRAEFMRKCLSNKNDPRGPAIGTPAAPGAPKG